MQNVLFTVILYHQKAVFSGSQIGSRARVLRHYFTYQGQMYSDDFVDIQRHKSVGDMQMFLMMEREDIIRANVFRLHMMLWSPWAPQSSLCVRTQTHHLSSPPSLFSILSPLLHQRVTPAD